MDLQNLESTVVNTITRIIQFQTEADLAKSILIELFSKDLLAYNL